MPAYFIFIREEPVRDAAAMAQYKQMNREHIGEFEMKPLAVYGAMETFEGDAPDGAVVLEFPSMEEARAWYNSDGYQAALPHRFKAAKYRAFLVEGM